MTDRIQTVGEEIANSVSHGVSLLAAVAALPVLVVSCSDGTVASLVGAIVFGVTMLLLYTASTLYHALPAGRAKEIFNKLDHGAIYVFIAGSYTPFALGALAGSWGWALFGLVWAMAAAGVALAAVLVVYHPWSTPAPRPEPRFSEDFAELFAMDDILGRATPLLDPENRDALLHLPANPSPSSPLPR